MKIVVLNERKNGRNVNFTNNFELPCMAEAFLRSSRHARDLNYLDLLQSTGRSLISRVEVSCLMKVTSVVQDWAPSQTRVKKHRRGGMCSLGKGNHPIMTQQANNFRPQINNFCFCVNFANQKTDKNSNQNQKWYQIV